MIFPSAGHHLKDPGAIASGRQENKEMIAFRDLVVYYLKKMGAKFITDSDSETLQEYLNRIKTGEGSVVCEFHLDSSGTGKATGVTAIVGSDADRLDKAFAKELADTTAKVLSINNRGVKSEADSHRGRLGLMREQGIVSLLEVCFIDNVADMKQFDLSKNLLASEIAQILVKYENMVA